MRLEKTVSLVLETTKQEKEIPKWIETSVWTESMLAALSNGVKGGKWFSLIDKVYSLSTLTVAWQRVKENRGNAGIDKISIKRFDVNADKYLEELHETLKNQTYLPDAIKRVYILKDAGKLRPLGIPTVKDRIVQTAIKMVIEPIFEQEFLPISYGFRPNKDCKDALREVNQLITLGNTYVVDADIESCFDSIPHDLLMQQIEKHISDGKLLNLIKLFLQQKVMDGLKRWIPVSGTPQGSVLSPLFANIYLHTLDKFIIEKGLKLIRYADDFVILCNKKNEAKQALKHVRTWTNHNGLTLNSDKTHLGNCLEKGQGFEFLGYRFEAGRRWVRFKSIKALRKKVCMITKRSRSGSMANIITELNPILRGWFNYFKHAYRTEFKTIDGFIRRRLRALLLRRNKRKGWGKSIQAHMRWKNIYFNKIGLFTMHKVRLKLCQSR